SLLHSAKACRAGGGRTGDEVSMQCWREQFHGSLFERPVERRKQAPAFDFGKGLSKPLATYICGRPRCGPSQPAVPRADDQIHIARKDAEFWFQRKHPLLWSGRFPAPRRSSLPFYLDLRRAPPLPPMLPMSSTRDSTVSNKLLVPRSVVLAP